MCQLGRHLCVHARAFGRLYRYRMEPLIQTAETDYAANYDTNYEKPIKCRYFDQKLPIEP